MIRCDDTIWPATDLVGRRTNGNSWIYDTGPIQINVVPLNAQPTFHTVTGVRCTGEFHLSKAIDNDCGIDVGYGYVTFKRD